MKKTKSRKSDQRRSKNRGFFKEILDNVAFGGLYVDVDRTIRYCNRKAVDIFGYRPKEIMGSRTEFLYGDRRSDKSNKGEIFDALERDGFHIGSARGRTKNGKKIRLKLSTFLVKPNKGALVLIEDADKSKKATHDKGRLLQDLLDAIPDMIFFKDIDNKFIVVNKAHAGALHLIPEEVVGKSDLDFFPEEIGKKYFADDCKITKTGKGVVGKIEKAPRPDGGMTYVSTTKVPRYDENGRVIGIIGVTRNITDKMIAEEELHRYKDHLEELVEKRTKELNKTNEKLVHMYKVKSEFTSVVSHELRTPLTIVKDGIDLVGSGTLGAVNEKQARTLKISLDNVDRLARLINDVLDFSKFENRKMEFKIVKGNLNRIIEDVLSGYEATVKKKCLKLKIDLEPSLPLAKFDPDRIAQVIHNLINNAIKYTEKGSIAVESKRKAKEVCVKISDTGPGIRPEDLPRVFRKFDQLSLDESARKGGTGLGLAICKQIIEQLKGKISVASEYGKGTTFSFSLPIGS